MNKFDRIITARYIFDGEIIYENMAIIIKQGIISRLIKKQDLANLLQNEVDASVIIRDCAVDYGDCIIAPGFIDLQQNGCGGVLFNDDICHDTLMTMHKTNLRYGTCGFLPTLITTKYADMIKALETVKAWVAQYGFAMGVRGIHLEGPFLSKEKPGIHPLKFIRKPNDLMLAKIASYTKYFPVKMTIAVENFTQKQMEFLANNGVILSLGHTNASYEIARNAINSGYVKSATHLFNAMSGLTGRAPGVVGAVLNSTCYAGIIADLHHVSAANIELVHKIKPQQMYLVTDAVTPAGTSLKEFDLAGKHLWVKGGRCIDENGVLGGAQLTMNKAVENCVNSCNIQLIDALKMASLIPAEVLGISANEGRLARGYNANLTVINLRNFKCKVI